MKNEYNIPPEIKLQLLVKILEATFGYEYAHKLIDNAEMEYKILKTNEVLERR